MINGTSIGLRVGTVIQIIQIMQPQRSNGRKHGQ
jgi:hypothetical protein